MRQKANETSAKQVNIHLTSYEKTRLDEIAQAQRRPVAQLVRIIVQDYIEAHPVQLVPGGEVSRAPFHLAPGNHQMPI